MAVAITNAAPECGRFQCDRLTFTRPWSAEWWPPFVLRGVRVEIYEVRRRGLSVIMTDGARTNRPVILLFFVRSRFEWKETRRNSLASFNRP